MVVGLALVLAGVTITQIWLGVIGFVIMVAGGAYAVAPPGRPSLGSVQSDGSVTAHSANRSRGAASGSSSKPSGAGFMDRLEQRWERRREQGGW